MSEIEAMVWAMFERHYEVMAGEAFEVEGMLDDHDHYLDMAECCMNGWVMEWGMNPYMHLRNDLRSAAK